VKPRAGRFWAVLLVVTGLALAPLLAHRFVVGIDYPTHLSMIRVLRLWFEDRARFEATFGTRLLQPYWGMYLPALLLSSVMSIDVASKLVTAAALAAMPIALARLAMRVGADRRVALLGVPLMFNHSFYWGFVPFLCGLALALLSLPSALDGFERDRKRDVALLALWAAAICVAHATAWAMWAAWTAWLALSYAPRPAQLARTLAAIAWPAPFLIWYQTHLPRTGNLAYVLDQADYHNPFSKLVGMWHISFTAGPVIVEVLLFVLLLAAIAVSWRGTREPEARLRMFRWGGLALWMLVAYEVLPQDVAGISFAYQRFLVFAFYFALLGAASSLEWPTIFNVLTGTLIVIYTAFRAVMFHAYDVEMSGMADCLKQARPGSSLAGLIGAKAPDTAHMPLFLHADNLHTMWNLGPVFAHSMTLLPTTPVYFKKDAFHNPPPPAFDWHPERLDWERNGQYIDYFLIRDSYLNYAEFPQKPLKPDLWYFKQGYAQNRMVCQAGFWRLWENTRPASP
jgi:hypothetical protein